MDPAPSINTVTSSQGRLPLLSDAEIGVAPVGGTNAQPKPATRGASVASVAFVLLNTALGSGILGLPGAFAKAGMIGGIALLIVTSILAVFTVHLLCEVADRVGRPASFFSVSKAAAGAQAGVLIDLLLAINAFGCSTSYLIVVGDVLPEVSESFGAPGLLTGKMGRNFWMLISLAVGAPLAYLRDLSALSVTAYVAFLCVVYISAVVGIFAIFPSQFDPCSPVNASIGDDEGCRGAVKSLTTIPTALDAMPIFIFAYTTNQNAISITNELVRPTSRRILAATCLAMVLALSLYLLTGIGGYSTYGDKVNSDILKSYPDSATLPIIARIAIAFVVTTCYPMQIHPGRNSLMSIMSRYGPSGCIRALGGEQGTLLLIIATSLLVAGSIVVALLVKSLGVMLTIIGSICSTSVSFIVPGGCYVLLFKERGWTCKRMLALLILLLGCIIAPLCLVLTFLPMGKNADDDLLWMWV